MDLAPLVGALGRATPLAAVNFHNTPAARAAEYDAQLAAIARAFEAATEDTLAAFLATGRWPGRRPGVVLAFYNGTRNNFDVARPLLERHGLTGWFFAVSGWSSCAASGQLDFAAAHSLATVPGEYPDGRYALSWDEVRALDRGGHVIASHTRNHARVTDAEGLEEEIAGSQADFSRELGHSVRSFAWLLGGAYGESPPADRAVDRAGYEFLFSNFRVQRLPRPLRAPPPPPAASAPRP